MLEFQASTISFSHDIKEVSKLTDDLGRVKIAQAIADQLRSYDERPRVIGVYGWWGSGKSHLLSQTIRQLQESNQTEKLQVIPAVFEAWQYEMAGDLAPGLIRSLMTVHKQFGNASILTGPQTYQSIGQGVLDLVALVGPWTGPGGQVAAGLSQLAKWGIDNVSEYQKRVAPPEMADIHSKMEELVQAILSSAYEQDSSKEYRLVVFVDDLDRCSPENMVRMFEWLKVHLAAKGCTYVLALDNIAAARAIVGRYKTYLSREADLEYGLRYLEKLVDNEYDLGLPLETDLQWMAIQRIFGSQGAGANKNRTLSGAMDGLYALGYGRKCYAYMDQLLALRALRNPRTMLKIVYKYRLALDILTQAELKSLRDDLGDDYPFWALLLVALYYRLEPNEVNDFIQGRGHIHGLFGSPGSIPKERWAADVASPMFQFCQLADELKDKHSAELVLPQPQYLRQLAAIIRENVFSGADTAGI